MPVWLCGYNGFNQILAHCSDENSAVVSSPILVKLKSVCPLDSTAFPESKSSMCDITDAAVGWSKIYLAAHNGRLYMPEGSNILQNEFSKFLTEHSRSVKSVSFGWTTACVVVNGRSDCFVWNEKESTAGSIRLSDSENATDVITNDVTVFVTTSDRRLLSADIQRIAEPSNLVFQPLLPEFHIRTVSCGKHHVLLLSVIGVIFSYGNGGQGQLGHGSVEHKLLPTVVEALEGVTVTSIAAGGWHSLAVTDAGDLYAWGWNERGQLGLPSENVSCKQKNKGKLVPADGAPCDDNQYRPRKRRSYVVEAEPERTSYVSAADLDDLDGSSLPPFVNVLTLPHVVEFPGMSDDVQVLKVAAGSRHTVALLEDGCVSTWGWNEYGQLGLGDTVSRDSPNTVALFSNGGIRVTNVFAGWWNTVFVTE